MQVETASPWSCDCKDHFCLKQLMPCSLRCIWPWFGPLIPHRITLADIQAKSSDFICNANSILVQVFIFLFLKRFAIWIVFHHGCSTDQYSHLIANTGISYKFICIQEYGILHHKLILQLLLSVVWLASYHHFVVYALLVIRPVCSNNNCGS